MNRLFLPASVLLAVNAGAQMTTNSFAVRQPHPRLMLPPDLKAKAAGAPLLADWRRQLRERGEKLLHESPLERDIADGVRLLTVSRAVLERVQLLVLLYRLDGDARFRDRCWRELEAVARSRTGTRNISSTPPR